jgi:hypothetical protein
LYRAFLTMENSPFEEKVKKGTTTRTLLL